MVFGFLSRNTKPPLKPFDFARNPYRAHTRWPPVFSKLNQKEQFRMERKFRRRSKLKWARPIWNRNLRLVQWASTLFILGYGIFFIDWDDTQKGVEEGAPGSLQGIRLWYRGLTESLWTHASSADSRESIRKSRDEARYAHTPASRGEAADSRST